MSELKRYRKKPVVIEAWQIETYHDIGPIARWIQAGGRCAVPAQDPDGPAYLLIDALEGAHRADIRDFVIRGVAGEFYPCKPDIFAATYERERGHADE